MKADNKGFSLVELIIVIAIMAILIGAVGVQVIPYLNNAKYAKDIQILSAIGTASMVAYTRYADLVSQDEPLVIVIVPGTDTDIYTCDAAQKIADYTKELVKINYLLSRGGNFYSGTFKKVDEIRVYFDFATGKMDVRAYANHIKVSKDYEVTTDL